MRPLALATAGAAAARPAGPLAFTEAPGVVVAGGCNCCGAVVVPVGAKASRAALPGRFPACGSCLCGASVETLERPAEFALVACERVVARALDSPPAVSLVADPAGAAGPLLAMGPDASHAMLAAATAMAAAWARPSASGKTSLIRMEASRDAASRVTRAAIGPPVA
jgi:hypothetical protein